MVKTIKNKRNKRKSKKILGGSIANAMISGAAFLGSAAGTALRGRGTAPPAAGQPPNPVQNPVLGSGFKEPNRGTPDIGGPKEPNTFSSTQLPPTSSPSTLKVSSILPFNLNDGKETQLVEYKTLITYLNDMNRRVNAITKRLNDGDKEFAKTWAKYKEETSQPLDPAQSLQPAQIPS
jgi:hypothetical protein